MKPAKFLYAIGIALFVFIVFNTGPANIIAGISRLDPLLFFAVLFFTLPLLALKAVKQNVLLGAFGAKLPLAESARIWLIGYFLSVITPGRSGDFLRALYLSRGTGVSSGSCLTAVAVERVLDLLCLFVLGIAGLALLSAEFGIELSALISLGLLFAAFCAAVLLVFNKKFVSFAARPLFNLLAPEKWKTRLSAGFKGFYEGLLVYRRSKRSVALAAFLTLINWLASILQYYLIAVALGLQLPLFFLVIAMPVILLAEALPISISGVGTRDAAAIALLSLGGVQAAAAVGFSITILALNLVVAFFGMLLFQKDRIPV
ncbi:MAG: lysylphosphatidylglycerol synthase transmembrane domain-containing protein [Candidatus Diapherotrites archaeon]|nr:lysylphosphatidylglycerol synthase transmembrane domain-containing protein [Candidatus Diapherotrites archaeon]